MRAAPSETASSETASRADNVAGKVIGSGAEVGVVVVQDEVVAGLMTAATSTAAGDALVIVADMGRDEAASRGAVASAARVDRGTSSTGCNGSS